jgi:cyclopropane fatty-acyl-phospholipid synthase-like methyltransferase
MWQKIKGLFQKNNIHTSEKNQPKHSTKDVGEFYDQYTDKFLQVYGQVIQAFRTHDVNKLLNYQIDIMQLKDGMKVLDAGCGVCGPAIYFAQKTGVEIHAVTISKEQYKMSLENVKKAGLEHKIFVYHGDYHQLNEVVKQQDFDVVYFLESFGHSSSHNRAIDSAWDMLKQGGLLYIKDLFRREPLLPEHASKIEREIKKINEAYRYNIADLYEVLRHIRKQGWIVSKIKTIDLPLGDFENLTISNDFQELTGIAKIENWEDYIFPIDFFELHLIKPQFNLENGLDKYFLQNLMYMQIYGKNQEML